MAQSIIKDKSFAFAIAIVSCYKFLITEKEFILSKQLLRSGTSIGANVAEALSGSSKKDFANKLNIALKEAHESLYWLELLSATNYLNNDTFLQLRDECKEIIKILSSIILTTRQNESGY